LDTCDYLGYSHGERRCRSRDGAFLLTWDGQHGEIEVYDRFDRHLGARDAITGDWIKNAVRGRWIDV